MCACCWDELSFGCNQSSCDDCIAQYALCKKRTGASDVKRDATIGDNDTLSTVFARILQGSIYSGFVDSFIISLLLQSDEATKTKVMRVTALGAQQHIFNLDAILSLANEEEKKRLTNYIEAVEIRTKYNTIAFLTHSLEFGPNNMYNKLLWSSKFVKKIWKETKDSVCKEFKQFMQDVAFVSPRELEEGEVVTDSKFASSNFAEIDKYNGVELESREKEARELEAREKEARELEEREKEARELEEREKEARELKEREKEARELEEREKEARELEERESEKSRKLEDHEWFTASQKDSKKRPAKEAVDALVEQELQGTGRHREVLIHGPLIPKPNFWTFESLMEALFERKTHKLISSISQDAIEWNVFDASDKDGPKPKAYRYKTLKTMFMQMVPQQIQEQVRADSASLWIYVGTTLLKKIV